MNKIGSDYDLVIMVVKMMVVMMVKITLKSMIAVVVMIWMTTVPTGLMILKLSSFTFYSIHVAAIHISYNSLLLLIQSTFINSHRSFRVFSIYFPSHSPSKLSFSLFFRMKFWWENIYGATPFSCAKSVSLN